MKKIPTPVLLGSVLVITAVVMAMRARNAVLNVNEGTPFEGFGALGTLGNATNAATGGLLGNVGSSVGLFFSNIFDRRTVEDLTNGPS